MLEFMLEKLAMIFFAIFLGSAAGIFLRFPWYLSKEIMLEREWFRLHAQTYLAIRELKSLFHGTLPNRPSLPQLREVVRRLNTIEGLTLLEAEKEAGAMGGYDKTPPGVVIPPCGNRG